jgi:phage major head subunit gpT-like protein
MIINQEALARLYTGFTAVFNTAFQDTQTWHERVAMTVPANTRIMDYKFLLDFPMVREWIGDRQISSLEPKAYQVESKDWEATIEVDRNDIEDDQLGLYNPIISALAQEARKHPEKLIADLLGGGFTTTCYDGQNFFAADHPVGTGTVANLAGGAGTAWYLMDTSRAVKPFIFQLRREVQLVRMDRQDDEHAFMRKKLRYGVDYRGAAAFGLWQLAYASKETLTAANYAAARAAMMSVKNAEGRPLGLKPNLMLVPPVLEAEAREILQAQFIIGDPGSGGAKTNIWQGTADLLVVPELT